MTLVFINPRVDRYFHLTVTDEPGAHTSIRNLPHDVLERYHMDPNRGNGHRRHRESIRVHGSNLDGEQRIIILDLERDMNVHAALQVTHDKRIFVHLYGYTGDGQCRIGHLVHLA